MRHLAEMTASELAEAADDNFAVHATWAHARTPGMRVDTSGHVVLADAGLATDTFTLACRARFQSATARTQIRDALAFFQHTGRPFSWWVGPGDQPENLGTLLEEAGLVRADGELAMAADLNRLDAARLPENFEIRRITSAGEFAEYARVLAGPQEQRFYECTMHAFLSPDAPQWFYLGLWNGQPVATSEVTLAGGVAGLYNVVTAEHARRRGFGTAMTIRPLLDARAAGYHTGVLQATEAGAAVYRTLGFRPFGMVSEYKPPQN